MPSKYAFIFQILNPVEVSSGEDYSKNELVLYSEMSGLEPDSYSYNSTPDITLYIELTTDLFCEYLRQITEKTDVQGVFF